MATLTLDTAQTSLLDDAAPVAERDAVAAPAGAEARGAVAEPAAVAAPRVADGGAAGMAGAQHGPTLDEVVARTWSALRVARAADCLLCGGEVAPRYGSGPHPVGGVCRSCGTELS